MKLKKISFLLAFVLSALIILFLALACDDSNPEELILETTSIESLITEADALVKNSVEGMQPGLYMPGSIDELEKELNLAKSVVEAYKSQESIADAADKLKEAIDTFKTKVLRAAIPYIKQKAGSYIKISDEIKYTTRTKFTMETDYYFMDLNPIGYSNTIFSCAQMEPDSGFDIRTFADGHVEIVIGNGDWTDAKSEPGVIKVGEWMNFAFTSTGQSHKFYVNGVEVISLDAKHLPANDAAVVIGNGYVFNDRVVNAMVKDVRVWNTVRTQAEISENMDNELNGKESGLKAYFPLSVDLGTEFYDLTNSFKANLVGSIELIYDGGMPEIILNYSKLEAAITAAEELKNTIVEGSADGEYPAGTKDFIQKLIDGGESAKNDAKWQKDVDKETNNIVDALEIVKGINIAPTLPSTGKYSAVFGGGSFYSGGDAAILDMKNSGFTTAILWTVHIGEDASMVFNDKGVIDQNGNYIGDPEWGTRLATLLEAPTTVDRIELGIGAWGAKSWENIKKLIDADGTGSDTKLYKAIKKLVDVTGATAINYDDELTYDVESTVAFSLMLADMGLKVSLCPYTQTSYWQSVYQQVEAEKPGTIDRVYLQCYAGGASNSPSGWNQYFGDLKVSMGLWCRHGSSCNEGDSPSQIQNKISANKDNIDGGFIWLYDDIRACSNNAKTQEYATAINTEL
ncbi:LamG domain-containing protein [Carboxylicivirga sp. N1Y90]|uniref:LamG domain-containing protein n=1 Tax=Carboxylicivirga fragile TaxID=3417571 RepID=UPI003D34FFBD|nr:LamG domain-containing protein [Marinilabiliaceae bacterium N1Y90]